MRRLTLALLCGAYLCLALIVAVMIWRNGGGMGAGIAALVGSLGLAFAFHGLIEQAVNTAALRREITAVRQAHLVLADQLEQMVDRLGEGVTELAGDALRRTDEISNEVHLLEGLVTRLSERLDASRREPREDLFQPGTRARRGNPSSHVLNAIQDALSDNRVDLYLQPVVNLPQRRTLFYEGYSRLRDETGRVMMPSEYLSVAEPEGLMAAIDNLLLFRCVQIIRRLAQQDRKVGIFCNISLESLGDESFFPQFLEFLSANRDLGDSLIFELGQAAFEDRGPMEARHMSRLGEMGFRFSLDKVTDLDLDFANLARFDVRFVKIGAQVLLDELVEDGDHLVLRSAPDLQAGDYARLARRYGLDLIVEKVESERQIVDILDLDIGFGQGNLFGEPRAIREAVLAEVPTPPVLSGLRNRRQRR